jgi:hypothetical protein
MLNKTKIALSLAIVLGTMSAAFPSTRYHHRMWVGHQWMGHDTYGYRYGHRWSSGDVKTHRGSIGSYNQPPDR